jgi:two-component system sensor histidine kinase/response regulator
MTLIISIFLLVQSYNAVLLVVIIAIVAFLIRLAYLTGLKKSIKNIVPHSENNFKSFPDTPQQLNSLINSLNDIIFEFDEDKVCLNVWFNPFTERVVDPKQAVGKKLEDILGVERALKFNNALDYVITTKKSTSVEYISDYGTGKWLIAKLSPVFDREGNYTSRISASVSDISAQKMYAEAVCRSFKRKRGFIARSAICSKNWQLVV